MTYYGWHWFLEWQTPSEFHGHEVVRVLAEEKSQYQEVKLVELKRFGKSLIIDGKTQSTVSDEFIYHESLVHPLLLSSRAENVLILGGGEGATLREVLRYKSVKKVVMVDIDGVVIDFAKKFMKEWHRGAFFDPRAEIVIGDGLEFIKNTGETFDAIVLDLTDPMKDSPSYKLYTKEFYESLKRILKGGGRIVTQSTSPSFSLESFSVIYNTLSSVFNDVRAGISYVPAFDGLWGFTFATDKEMGSMSEDEIDLALREEGISDLQYYDGKTHIMMFNIPKYIRRTMSAEKRVSTEQDPIFVPA